MKINDELLFFMIKSRLFAPLSFSLPPSVAGGASPIPFAFGAGRLCPHSSQLPLPDHHPSAAPSACLPLGLEISHCGPLNCCKIALQNDVMSEGTSAFCHGPTKLFCLHHPGRGPSPAPRGCTGMLRVWGQISSLVL